MTAELVVNRQLPASTPVAAAARARTGRGSSSPRVAPATGAATTIRARTHRVSFHVVRDCDPAYPLGETVDRAASAAEIARHVIGDAITEVLLAVFLDARRRVLGFAEIARGTLNANRFTPKDVLVPALYANASHIVICHCHPSGDPRPSPADAKATDALRQAADIVGIPLVDHIIVAGAASHSFSSSDGWAR